MTDGPDRQARDELQRRLGTGDAVVIGLGSMIGAGIFAALAPAAAAAGSSMLIGVAAAALVAYFNATSTARCAARYPESGGAYVYGRRQLGEFWGYLAGWGFVVGKTASCAAMALVVGSYAWPAHAHLVAVGAVLTLTAINYTGIRKSLWVTRVIVAVVLTTLAGVAALALKAPQSDLGRIEISSGAGIHGVLQATGLLFFAFAGYARIATLGEEVRDPSRTIRRAIPTALGIALVVYAVVAIAVLAALGSSRLARSVAPIADAVGAAGAAGWEPVVRLVAVLAALGSLLSLILGVSRTTFAMARDHYLPQQLSAVHPTFTTPYRAEVAVGIAVAVLAGTAEIRGAIGFSSFAVLVYYAIANASAWTLGARIVPALGVTGCVVVALALPLMSVVTGLAALLAGAAVYQLRRCRSAGPPRASGQKKNPA
jgi:APA family basic amino acid/polyamine antiporter